MHLSCKPGHLRARSDAEKDEARRSHGNKNRNHGKAHGTPSDAEKEATGTTAKGETAVSVKDNRGGLVSNGKGLLAYDSSADASLSPPKRNARAIIDWPARSPIPPSTFLKKPDQIHHKPPYTLTPKPTCRRGPGIIDGKDLPQEHKKFDDLNTHPITRPPRIHGAPFPIAWPASAHGSYGSKGVGIGTGGGEGR